MQETRTANGLPPRVHANTGSAHPPFYISFDINRKAGWAYGFFMLFLVSPVFDSIIEIFIIRDNIWFTVGWVLTRHVGLKPDLRSNELSGLKPDLQDTEVVSSIMENSITSDSIGFQCGRQVNEPNSRSVQAGHSLPATACHASIATYPEKAAQRPASVHRYNQFQCRKELGSR